MKLCPKPLKKEGENNQRILKIRSGKLMKTKTENKKKLDKTNMNIPELKWGIPLKRNPPYGILLREPSIGIPF